VITIEDNGASLRRIIEAADCWAGDIRTPTLWKSSAATLCGSSAKSRQAPD